MNNTLTTNKRVTGSSVAVTQSTPSIGAEISGLDLRDTLSPSLSAELRSLLVRFKVLFFRNQEIDTGQLMTLAKNFGSVLFLPETHDAHPEYPGVQIISDETKPSRPDRRRGEWHIDCSGLIISPCATILHAVTIPPVGGDTIWANLAAAYEGLSDELKQTIDGLYLTQGGINFFRERGIEYPRLSYPIVRTHPETNEKVLYVNFLSRPWVTDPPWITGWSPEKSAELIRQLKEEATRPEYQVRFRWSPSAIAVWDNRAVLHYAVNDYDDSPRRMERILVAKPPPTLFERLL
jgi:alpha-ketoglutarate-dependent taurine dioxygenase